MKFVQIRELPEGWECNKKGVSQVTVQNLVALALECIWNMFGGLEDETEMQH
jgi:hypothetical protein